MSLLTTLRRRGGAPYPAAAPNTVFSFIGGTGLEQPYSTNGAYYYWRDQSGNGNDAVGDTVTRGVSALPGDWPIVRGCAREGMEPPPISLSSPYTYYFIWSRSDVREVNNQYFTRDASGTVFMYWNVTSDVIYGGFNGPTIDADDSSWYVIRVISTGGATSKITVHDGTTPTTGTGTLNKSFTDRVVRVGGGSTSSSGLYGALAWFQVVDAAADPANDPIMDALVERLALLPKYGNIVNIDKTTYNAFGNVALDDSTLVAVYRRGVSHFDMPTNPGDLYISTATSPGTTWSAPALLFTDAVDSYDARDPRITITSSGRWIVLFFLHDGTNALPYVIYSDNQGSTWTSKILVTSSFTTNIAACSGPILQLANGDLLAALYWDGDVRFSRSTDDGATWADEGELIQPAAGTYTEPNLGLTDDGNVMMLVRHSGLEIYRIVGTYSAGDGSISWGSASSVCDGTGAPGWTQASDGTVYLTDRTVDWYGVLYPMALRTSSDRGVTWSDEKFPFPFQDIWEYGNPVELANGDIYLFWCQEMSGDLSIARWAKYEE